RRQRTRLILLHDTAIADHIGGKDGGEPTLDALFGHRAQSLQRTQHKIVWQPRRGVYWAGLPVWVKLCPLALCRGSSAKPPKADIWGPAGNYGEVPIADIVLVLDGRLVVGITLVAYTPCGSLGSKRDAVNRSDRCRCAA